MRLETEERAAFMFFHFAKLLKFTHDRLTAIKTSEIDLG